MNLTPEQTDIGKKNFLAAMGSTVMASPTDANASHRDFLRGAIEKNLASKAGLGGYYYGYSEPDRPVRVAVLGTGDEGNVLLGAINPKFIEVVAIADIRPYSISRAFNGDVLGGELADIPSQRLLLNAVATDRHLLIGQHDGFLIALDIVDTVVGMTQTREQTVGHHLVG